jgi:hypothetical protein
VNGILTDAKLQSPKQEFCRELKAGICRELKAGILPRMNADEQGSEKAI